MEKKIKILHANTGLVAGGAERLISDMAPLLKNSGIKLELLLLEDKGNNIFEEQILETGIHINKMRFNNKFDPRNLLEIRKIIKKFDIIHVHLFPILYLIPIAAFGLKKKPILITTEHNTHNRRRNLKFLKRIEKFIYAKYDKIISISPESERNLLSWLDEKKSNKYEVVLNGINTELFKNSKAMKIKEVLRINIGEEDKFLLMVARFDSQKDHETLFKALQILPGYIKLILIGEGKLEEHYKRKVIELGIMDRVFFIGRRNDIHNILKSIDISVLSSHWEGFGLVTVEAMSAGVPVIASDVPGVENIVRNYGLLFEKGNYQELAKHITALINNEAIYKYYSNLGLKRAEDFNIKKMVDEYISIYEEQYNHKGIK